eukprot:maker-scaffold1449_size40816-snap-gene-0.8 protein:Tk03398 transcript:maker-scaffold1449_size40816-snap-gene-0.8-mRNA-1 annotation:"pentatricopeptide repeat-containing protein at2g25580-like"
MAEATTRRMLAIGELHGLPQYQPQFGAPTYQRGSTPGAYSINIRPPQYPSNSGPAGPESQGQQQQLPYLYSLPQQASQNGGQLVQGSPSSPQIGQYYQDPQTGQYVQSRQNGQYFQDPQTGQLVQAPQQPEQYAAAAEQLPLPQQSPVSSYSQFEIYNQEQQARQGQLLRDLEAQQNRLIQAPVAPKARSTTQAPAFAPRAVPALGPEQPTQAAVQPVQASNPGLEQPLQAIQATGEVSSQFIDTILADFGGDISPEAKEKAEEIKTTFTNIASRLASFADRLQGIAEKVPQFTQLLSIHKAASDK